MLKYSLSEAGSDSELSSESSASELDESMRCARAASDEGTVRRESGISSISSSDSEPPCTQVTVLMVTNELPIATSTTTMFMRSFSFSKRFLTIFMRF